MPFPPAVEQWRNDVMAAFGPANADTALWVMMHESSGNPGARDYANSGHNGLFQVAGGSFDPRQNIQQAAAMFNASGWSPWGGGANTYTTTWGPLSANNLAAYAARDPNDRPPMFTGPGGGSSHPVGFTPSPAPSPAPAPPPPAGIVQGQAYGLNVTDRDRYDYLRGLQAQGIPLGRDALAFINSFNPNTATMASAVEPILPYVDSAGTYMQGGGGQSQVNDNPYGLMPSSGAYGNQTTPNNMAAQDAYQQVLAYQQQAAANPYGATGYSQGPSGGINYSGIYNGGVGYNVGFASGYGGYDNSGGGGGLDAFGNSGGVPIGNDVNSGEPGNDTGPPEPGAFGAGGSAMVGTAAKAKMMPTLPVGAPYSPAQWPSLGKGGQVNAPEPVVAIGKFTGIPYFEAGEIPGERERIDVTPINPEPRPEQIGGMAAVGQAPAPRPEGSDYAPAPRPEGGDMAPAPRGEMGGQWPIAATYGGNPPVYNGGGPVATSGGNPPVAPAPLPESNGPAGVAPAPLPESPWGGGDYDATNGKYAPVDMPVNIYNGPSDNMQAGTGSTTQNQGGQIESPVYMYGQGGSGLIGSSLPNTGIDSSLPQNDEQPFDLQRLIQDTANLGPWNARGPDYVPPNLAAYRDAAEYLRSLGVDPMLLDYVRPENFHSTWQVAPGTGGGYYSDKNQIRLMPGANNPEGLTHEELHAFEERQPPGQDWANVYNQQRPPSEFDTWHPGGITGYFDAVGNPDYQTSFPPTYSGYQIPPAVLDYLNQRLPAGPPYPYAKGGSAMVGYEDGGEATAGPPVPTYPPQQPPGNGLFGGIFDKINHFAPYAQIGPAQNINSLQQQYYNSQLGGLDYQRSYLGAMGGVYGAQANQIPYQQNYLNALGGVYGSQQANFPNQQNYLGALGNVYNARAGTFGPQQNYIGAQGNVIGAQEQQTGGQRAYIGQEQQANSQRIAEEQGIQAAEQNIPDLTATAQAQGYRNNTDYLYRMGGLQPPEEIDTQGKNVENLPPGVRGKIQSQAEILTGKSKRAEALRSLQLQQAKLAVDLLGTNVDAAREAAARVGLTVDQAKLLVQQAENDADVAGLAVKRGDLDTERARNAANFANLDVENAGLDVSRARNTADFASLASRNYNLGTEELGININQAQEPPAAGYQLYVDPTTGASSWLTSAEITARKAAAKGGSADQYKGMTKADLVNLYKVGGLTDDGFRAALIAKGFTPMAAENELRLAYTARNAASSKSTSSGGITFGGNE